MVSALKFKDEKEYREWLKEQSLMVKEKAKRFEAKFPGVIPLVVIGGLDTSINCGDYGEVHFFVHPSLENVLDKIID